MSKRRGPRLSIIPAGAVTDARLTPRALQVLCLLGRHTDDSGWCRIRQTRMADEIACARSTIQVALDLLYETKWVERRLEGRPGSVDPDPEKQPYASHAYRVLLDVQDDDDGDKEAEPDPDRCPENRAPHVPTHETAPGADVCIGTNERPLDNESERDARTREGKRPSIKRFLLKWPTAGVDNQAHTRRAWDALSDDECEACLEGIEAYLAELKKHGRKYPPAGWNYLEEKLWELISKPTEATASHATVDCWSKEWFAVLFGKIERHEPVRFMVQHASEPGKRQWAVAAADMPTASTLSGFKAYPSDGSMVGAWRPWFEKHGVRFPHWEKQCWVFLPSPYPPGSTGPPPDDPLSDEDVTEFIESK